MYRPIHVGSKTSSVDLAIERDDVGNNISVKNHQYAELTALYWAWKNDLDSDFIGLGHYRRIPVFGLGQLRYKEWINYLKYFIKKYFMLSLPSGEYYLSQNLRMRSSELEALLQGQESSIREILAESILLVPRKTYFATNCVKSFFNRVVSDEAFKDIESSILDESIREVFVRMQGGNEMYIGNICVMRRDLFNPYCEFIFGTLDNFVKISDEKGIKYSSRYLGYLGELLTSSYLMHLQEIGVRWSSFDLAEVTDV